MMTEEKKEERGSLTPFTFDFPTFRFGNFRFPRLFEEFGREGFPSSAGENLTISEDDSHFYVEAGLPGLAEDDIEATIDENFLWIRGTKKEEESDKKKKFYRKASRSFSYSVALPNNIDESREPEAEFKDGLMKITFAKQKQAKSKKINIKRS